MRVALKGASDGPGYDHILSIGMPGKASSFQNLESDMAMMGTMKKWLKCTCTLMCTCLLTHTHLGTRWLRKSSVHTDPVQVHGCLV